MFAICCNVGILDVLIILLILIHSYANKSDKILYLICRADTYGSILREAPSRSSLSDTRTQSYPYVYHTDTWPSCHNMATDRCRAADICLCSAQHRSLSPDL